MRVMDYIDSGDERLEDELAAPETDPNWSNEQTDLGTRLFKLPRLNSFRTLLVKLRRIGDVQRGGPNDALFGCRSLPSSCQPWCQSESRFSLIAPEPSSMQASPQGKC
jgi:hypothetical protein